MKFKFDKTKSELLRKNPKRKIGFEEIQEISAIQRVNVDFSKVMLNELDEVAAGLNVSRQAVIKTYIRQSLDQHYLAEKSHAKTE